VQTPDHIEFVTTRTGQYCDILSKLQYLCHTYLCFSISSYHLCITWSSCGHVLCMSYIIHVYRQKSSSQIILTWLFVVICTYRLLTYHGYLLLFVEVKGYYFNTVIFSNIKIFFTHLLFFNIKLKLKDVPHSRVGTYF